MNRIDPAQLAIEKLFKETSYDSLQSLIDSQLKKARDITGNPDFVFDSVQSYYCIFYYTGWDSSCRMYHFDKEAIEKLRMTAKLKEYLEKKDATILQINYSYWKRPELLEFRKLHNDSIRTLFNYSGIVHRGPRKKKGKSLKSKTRVGKK